MLRQAMSRVLCAVDFWKPAILRRSKIQSLQWRDFYIMTQTTVCRVYHFGKPAMLRRSVTKRYHLVTSRIPNAYNAATSDFEGFVCGRFLKAGNTEAIKNRVTTMTRLLHNDPNLSLPSLSFLKACNAEAISNEEISLWLRQESRTPTMLRQAMLKGFVCAIDFGKPTILRRSEHQYAEYVISESLQCWGNQ